MWPGGDVIGVQSWAESVGCAWALGWAANEGRESQRWVEHQTRREDVTMVAVSWAGERPLNRSY